MTADKIISIVHRNRAPILCSSNAIADLIKLGPSFFRLRRLTNTPLPPKPFKTHKELIDLLVDRAMVVHDPQRAQRKLAQVGYYRLSGFWFPCRKFDLTSNGRVKFDPQTKLPLRLDEFKDGTDFNKVFELYLFDKNLRILMLDAIERIETHIRAVIAHELAQYDVLAYQADSFIDPRQLQDFTDKNSRKVRNIWKEWSTNHKKQLDRSKEDYILWHRNKKKAIPFWVAIEAWDLGTLSKYFEILKAQFQGKIARQLGIKNPKILVNWLHSLNILRNKCAHHCRIWNLSSNRALSIDSSETYFSDLQLTDNQKKRLYGLIAIIWYLIRRIGPSSTWINDLASIIDSKPELPGCDYIALGIPEHTTTFPIHLFK